MTTENRLAKSDKVRLGSVYTAAEYAARAEAAGHQAKAKLWRKAEREGWDELNHDPVAAAAHKRKIDTEREGWGGGRLYTDFEKGLA